MKKISLMFVCLLVIFSNICFAEGDNDKAIFEDRLYKYLTAPGVPDFSISEQQIIAANNLRKFSEEYPDSEYADDSLYLLIIFVTSFNKDVIALEQLVNKYPNGKIEDFTLKFIEDKLGKLGPGPSELYMPYALALIFCKGEKSFMTEKNYSEAIKYFSEFISNADEKNPQIMKAVHFAYTCLVISYRNLDRKNEGEGIKNKAIALFPEDKERLEKIWSSPVPKR